jgi:START domain
MASARAFTAILAASLALATASPSFADEGQRHDSWIVTSNESGIAVSRKEIPGSSFLAFRGEGDVDDPLLLVGSVLVDITRDREWIDSVVEARILRTVSETEYVTYTHVGTPIAMSDRDFVTDVTLSVQPAERRLTIRMHSINDPVAPRTSYVRGDLDESSFTLTSIDGGARTHVVAEIHCDPKGSIAAWMVNSFQTKWGLNTLKRLRAQVKKPDIAVHPRLKAVLEEKGFFE